ncbi:MAG: acyltransferase [Verrucomicrobia bacterium]|nr:acyltransferase [Verrucomicrobiota bacterium]
MEGLQPDLDGAAELGPGQLLPENLLRRALRSCGRGTRVFRGCRLLPPEAISMGDFCQIDEGVMIFAGEGVVLGRHVHMAFGSSISGGGWCEIGDFAGIGAGVRLITGTEVVDGSGLTNPTIPASYRAVHRGRVVIGAHAVVFTNAVVLPDVVVGEGAIVAAGSVVHRDLKPWCVYAGNPIVQVGTRPAEKVIELARRIVESESGESFGNTTG